MSSNIPPLPSIDASTKFARFIVLRLLFWTCSSISLTAMVQSQGPRIPSSCCQLKSKRPRLSKCMKGCTVQKLMLSIIFSPFVLTAFQPCWTRGSCSSFHHTTHIHRQNSPTYI
ncbi:hypothetical protein EDB19DRAFT_1728959 [Suillus lakei]|nr:hypothetical protein EDB19DRAFT_1728959 [Suillus lakei]